VTGVPSEQDVWRAAEVLVRRHGLDAPLYVLQSVDQLIERGDLAAAGDWRRVLRATRQLLSTADGPHTVN
jgi:hypothetical protein